MLALDAATAHVTAKLDGKDEVLAALVWQSLCGVLRKSVGSCSDVLHSSTVLAEKAAAAAEKLGTLQQECAEKDDRMSSLAAQLKVVQDHNAELITASSRLSGRRGSVRRMSVLGGRRSSVGSQGRSSAAPGPPNLPGLNPLQMASLTMAFGGRTLDQIGLVGGEEEGEEYQGGGSGEEDDAALIAEYERRVELEKELLESRMGKDSLQQTLHRAEERLTKLEAANEVANHLKETQGESSRDDELPGGIDRQEATAALERMRGLPMARLGADPAAQRRGRGRRSSCSTPVTRLEEDIISRLTSLLP